MILKTANVFVLTKKRKPEFVRLDWHESHGKGPDRDGRGLV